VCVPELRQSVYARLRHIGAGLVLLAPLPGAAQSAGPKITVAESLDLVRSARAAQRAFERTRRVNLPSESGSTSHTCDERIGRFCYWYEPDADPSQLEPSAIGKARSTLLDALTAVQQRLRGDPWIIGQLVRYLIEQTQPDSAVAAARACQATSWWCAALEGFARHSAGDFAGAESVYARAMRQMPDSLRCAWTDPRPLLDVGYGDQDRAPCPAADSAWQRIWWLSRPLYSRPGNDLLTEHLSRHVVMRLLEGAATPDGVPWGRDRFELVLRFGWPTRWSRPTEVPGSLSPSPILGHEPGPSFWFFPEPTLSVPWADITETRWNPGRERPPARYAPPYAMGFDTIDRVQFARFLRQDLTLTVATFDVSGDSVFRAHPADVRLAIGRDPSTPPIVSEISGGSRGTLSVRSRWRPTVLSLEAVAIDTPWVARRRAMSPPDPGSTPSAVSDLLLFAPSAELPESLGAALPEALRGAMVRRGQRLGLYWEMYDLPDSSATVEIAVTRRSGQQSHDLYPEGRPSCPFLQKPQVRLRWAEQPDRKPGPAARAVALDLHSLRRGGYTVTLQLRINNRARGCSSREFRIGES
jgi:hypothetical protein